MFPEITMDHIQTTLSRHEPRTADPREGLRPAAVLIPFYPKPGELSLIFTKRTNHLQKHAGQISFPGGGKDEPDTDLLQTALRETHEEIGVHPSKVDVWGRLNQTWTVTKFSVAPFVGAIPYPCEFRINPDEVERLIIVPLAHLLNPANVSPDEYPWKDRIYKNVKYNYQDDIIWGATARLVNNLTALLTTGCEPEPTPV